MDSREASRAFADLSTPAIADACLRAGVELRLAPPGLRPLVAGSRAAGRARPARHAGSVDVFLEVCAAAAPGDVLVIDNDGRNDEACIGDLTAIEARAAGLSAIVLWGSHRDTRELLAVGIPIWSYGALPAGPRRLDPRAPDALERAGFGSARVGLSDLVVADDDGALFLPAARAPELFAVRGVGDRAGRTGAGAVRPRGAHAAPAVPLRRIPRASPGIARADLPRAPPRARRRDRAVTVENATPARDAAAPAPETLRPRRTDRTVTDESWIRAFLHEAPVGVVGLAGTGSPYLNVNLFVYDEPGHAIFFHTWMGGRTRREIDAKPDVCFAAFRMGRLLPAERVADYSVEYAPVLVFGSVAVVADLSLARRVQEMQLAKYFPHKKSGRDFAPFTDAELARAAVYRLAIAGWSAKRLAGAPDHPGAFAFPWSGPG
jgi:regulator of RNase E activity RraA/nitroimidazol reductase NimA-like FMN-containing flavoprotein (pyridoxamine 5'-phosphate oxidase superfamily)